MFRGHTEVVTVFPSVLFGVDVMSDIQELARDVLEKNRVAIFIVAYNAALHIEGVLKRIPLWVAEKLTEIYIIDDSSTDNTVDVAQKIAWPKRFPPLHIYRTPYNQGYGGNQKLGYHYAIRKGFDIVVLLHGDGQYAPESLPDILAPYAEGADAVFGSRFLKSWEAFKGRMPLYKWVGNRILTALQNFVLHTSLSEMHSGYRSYRVSALRQIPFQYNSQGFDFDADIIVQLLAAGLTIHEVPIPTYYGDEICHVNGMAYAWRCIKTAIMYRLMQLEIFYDPKFAFTMKEESPYTKKSCRTSLHYFIQNVSLAPGSRLIDVGGGQGEAVSKVHANRGVNVTCIDQYADPTDTAIRQHIVEIEEPWESQFPVESYDTAFALDVLEHLNAPDKGAKEIFKHVKSGGKLYASTANVAFIVTRAMLALGSFNYGRRGILDLTHRRLMTVNSFRRLLKNAGFQIEKTIGFGVPLRDLVGSSLLCTVLDTLSFWFARLWPRLFAYQILVICIRPDSIEDLIAQTFPRAEIPRQASEDEHAPSDASKPPTTAESVTISCAREEALYAKHAL
jgi:glycosyltransferase involved in cell wall biosynthesis